MAVKKSTRAADTATVTRVVAKDTKEPAEKKAPKEKQVTKTPKERRNPVKSFGGYFVGAWQELKQVRWPNRRATWGMTAALLGFTAFFVALILLLDALFKYVFQLILG